ncbi:hypothetical protein ACFL0V_03880 [Nanoarchaeota archaeon]
MTKTLSLRERIALGQQQVARDEAMKALGSQTEHIATLDDLAEQVYDLQCIRAKVEGDWVYITPITRENRKGPIGKAVSEDLSDELGKYEPVEMWVDGHLAYRCTKKARGRMPISFQIDAGIALSLNFEDIGEMDLSKKVTTSAPRVRGKRRAKDDYGSLDPKEFYKPPCKPGTEFEVDLRQYSFDHNLINFHVGNRQHMPGYKVPFTLRYDGSEITTKMVSASKKKPLRGEETGNYCSGAKPIFEAHPELKKTMKLTMRVVKPGKVYEIVGYGR